MAKENSVSSSLIASATKVLLRVAFAFEPLAPTGIVVVLNRQLSKFKDEGAIEGYKTKAKRLGKYHYLLEVDLDVTGTQSIHLLSNLFPRQLSRYRRWFHD